MLLPLRLAAPGSCVLVSVSSSSVGFAGSKVLSCDPWLLGESARVLAEPAGVGVVFGESVTVVTVVACSPDVALSDTLADESCGSGGTVEPPSVLSTLDDVDEAGDSNSAH